MPTILSSNNVVGTSVNGEFQASGDNDQIRFTSFPNDLTFTGVNIEDRPSEYSFNQVNSVKFVHIWHLVIQQIILKLMHLYSE